MFDSLLFHVIAKPIATSLDHHLSVNARKEIDIEYNNNAQLSVIGVPTVLLGLGVSKSGTAFAKSLLCTDIYDDSPIDPISDIKSNQSVSFICPTQRASQEYHFWEKCPMKYHPISNIIDKINTEYKLFDDHGFLSFDNCSFKYYLDTFLDRNIKHLNFMSYTKQQNHRINKQDYYDNYEYIVLIDKDSSYFDNYHVSFLLTNYAKFKYIPLRFYVLWRDPIQRIWSQYWATCREYKDISSTSSSCQYNNTEMNLIIQQDIDKFPVINPDYYQILTILNETHDIDQIDTDSILNIMSYASYRFGQTQNNVIINFFDKMAFNPFMKSCYFNQLFMWYSMYNQSEFYHILKIIPSEYMYDNPRDIQWRLKCWGYFGGDYDLDDNKDKCKQNGEYKIKLNTKIAHIQYNKATGNNRISIVVKENLNNLLAGCNRLLFKFLNKNPQFILGQKLEFFSWLQQ